jgi:hypothetical protein
MNISRYLFSDNHFWSVKTNYNDEILEGAPTRTDPFIDAKHLLIYVVVYVDVVA